MGMLWRFDAPPPNGKSSALRERNMTFKQEFLEALESGRKHDSLLELIRKRQPQFANKQQIYDTLQEVWLDLGFDEKTDASPVRDELEFVMEQVWYQCPA
jgi:hypothetical protein